MGWVTSSLKQTQIDSNVRVFCIDTNSLTQTFLLSVMYIVAYTRHIYPLATVIVQHRNCFEPS